MKKHILALALMGFLALGCGNTASTETETEPTAEQVMAEKEAIKNDSIAREIEKTNAEIKKAAEDLDNILIELN